MVLRAYSFWFLKDRLIVSKKACKDARLKTALRLIQETDVQYKCAVYEKQNPTSRVVLASRVDRFQQTMIEYNGF